MLVRVQDTAAERVEQACSLHVLSSSSSVVIRLSLAEIKRAPPFFLCADGQIDLLEIHEEALVKAAQGLEHRPPDEKECSHHLIDLAAVMVVPLGHEMARKK